MTVTYSKFHPGKYSLWLDWETTGADFDGGYEATFKKFQGIQLGLVIADNTTFEEIDSLKINIKFNPEYTWTDGAEKVHGLSREWLEANGVDQEEACVEVIEFISKYFGSDVIYLLENGLPEFKAKVAVGGHNVRFDIAATQALLAKFGFGLAIHHVCLDTSALAFITIGEYKSDKVFAFFGDGVARGDHDALEDTRLALSVARGIRAIVDSVMNLAESQGA